MYPTSLFLFRRDLRLHDNLALNTALSASQQVVPCFILDKNLLRQIGSHWPRVQYLLAALQELDASLREHGSRLHVVYDNDTAGIAHLQKQCGAQAIYFHRDFSTYARRRDAAIAAQCKQSGIDCHAVDGITLHAPEQTLKADGTPYTVFTPFFRRAFQLPVNKPRKLADGTLAKRGTETLSLGAAIRSAKINMHHDVSPAAQARLSLKNLASLQDYETTRDIPAINGTSHLSVALRFGIVSPREAWWAIAQALGSEHPLLRQLYWRDFFFSIGEYFPRVFTGCFHQQYNRIRWPDNTDWIEAWKSGRTGFPIVDAGMRELRATGYMHNRVRMIVASFLVKDLHVDWRIGERHFAEQLLDYEPCINNGNWQWAASTGCDAQPYFRIFNPWTQQQKFDPDCIYIKHWVPELANIPARTLHNLFKLDHALPGYVKPIVEHGVQSRIAKSIFEDVRGSDPSVTS
ncbi:MAG TPA: deoxyribodipyrimidine photo-lyase [Pseudomonadales bacterium]|nr:deoxyribodipyrimidine photo-lyase [Pseudomonadales bacterium]